MTLKPSSLVQLQLQLHWVLRITLAGCFIGHGSWGLISKESWLPLFRTQGIPDEIAWKLMPIIGACDILVAILVLIKPRRIILIWMFVWALWTAILRPLSGTPGTWELWERAGNWMPPLMMIILGGTFALKASNWFAAYREPALDEDKLAILHLLGRLAIALLLIGHGGFGAFVEKQMIIDHFASIGIPANVAFINVTGWFEIGLGLFVFVFPTRPLYWFVLGWKVFTEFLYVTAGGILNLLEFIERIGDYSLPVAMIMIIHTQKALRNNHPGSPRTKA